MNTTASLRVITLDGQGDGPFLSPDGLVLTMVQLHEGGYDQGSTVVGGAHTGGTYSLGP